MSTYNEQLKKKYSPEGSKLRHDQLELLGMLKHLVEICKRNNIPWWLSSGTLLGAVRHQGFIPWDDDIDIVLLEKDYKRLQKILINEGSEEYIFHCRKTDFNYVNLFGKYRKRKGEITSTTHPRTKRYKYKGIGFDIFALRETSYISARCCEVIYKRILRYQYRIKNDWLRMVTTRFLERIADSLVYVLDLILKLFKKNGEMHYVPGIGWAHHYFDKKDIFPLKELVFEDTYFPVPNKTDSYLTRVFGDYMKIPSEDEINHSIHCKEYREEIYCKNNLER